MKAIILAAGEGKRMRMKKTPKCLLHYKGQTILNRLIKQLQKQEISEIIIVVGYEKQQVMFSTSNVTLVENEKYKQDTNIYSMYLGLKQASISEDVIVFESDIIAEDDFISYVCGTDFENRSTWFVDGKFKEGQYGGIIKTDGKGNVKDIKIVNDYYHKFRDWYKTIGVARFSKHQIPHYLNLLDQEERIDKYYHMVWKDNIDTLPSCIGNTEAYTVSSFNTQKEYYDMSNKSFEKSINIKPVFLSKVNDLHPIERYDKDRLSTIKKHVINNGNWIVPIKIEAEHNLILDGHHSYALAKAMNLKYIPSHKFTYADVDMWSLREELEITKEDVIKNALSNNLYPYKTVKHKFPIVDCNCKVMIDKLR